MGLLLCIELLMWYSLLMFFFFQAEDGIRDLVRSRGLGDVYKRQQQGCSFGDDLFLEDVVEVVDADDAASHGR